MDSEVVGPLSREGAKALIDNVDGDTLDRIFGSQSADHITEWAYPRTVIWSEDPPYWADTVGHCGDPGKPDPRH